MLRYVLETDIKLQPDNSSCECFSVWCLSVTFLLMLCCLTWTWAVVFTESGCRTQTCGCKPVLYLNGKYKAQSGVMMAAAASVTPVVLSECSHWTVGCSRHVITLRTSVFICRSAERDPQNPLRLWHIRGTGNIWLVGPSAETTDQLTAAAVPRYLGNTCRMRQVNVFNYIDTMRFLFWFQFSSPLWRAAAAVPPLSTRMSWLSHSKTSVGLTHFRC